MILRLAILSALEVVAFAGALAAFLQKITCSLYELGGSPDSYLAKISFGIRAIEKETSHLAPQVTRLNTSLGGLADKLGTVDEHLEAVTQALSGGQERMP